MAPVREKGNVVQKVEELKVAEAPQAMAGSSLIVAAAPAAGVPPSRNGSRPTAAVESERLSSNSAPKRGSALGSILASAVISVLFGGVGAWVFLTYLAPAVMPYAPSAARETAAGTAPTPVTPLGPSADDLKQLTKEIDDVSGRLDRLQERFSAIPHPEPPQDLSNLQRTISTLEKDSESYASLPGRLSALRDRMAALEQTVAALQNERNAANAQTKQTSGTLRLPRTVVSRQETPAPAQPSLDNAQDLDPDLAQAAELLRKGKFAEARDLCSMLEESHADDARVWYYGALAHGLATGRWDKETERLAAKGVERERVGSPSKANIDAAVASLKPISGGDWLASIRRNAHR